MSNFNVKLVFNSYNSLIPKLALDEELKLWNLPSTTSNNISQIRDWYTDNAAYYDKLFE